MAIISNLQQGIENVIVKRNVDIVLGGLNISNIEYDSNQNPIRIDYENNIKMYLTYDVNGNCIELVVKISNEVVEKWVYTYDSNSMLKTATRVVG